MEILLRLLPESPVRSKCVCKSWYTLISDPSSADKHLHFNNNRNSSSISIFLNWLRRNLYPAQVRSLVTISDGNNGKDNNDNFPCVIEDLNLFIIPHKGYLNFWRDSHCNGIIWLIPNCFYDNETVL